MSKFVGFDDVLSHVRNMLNRSPWPQDGRSELFIVRDLYGRVRLVTSESDEVTGQDDEWLKQAAQDLHDALGPRSHAVDDTVLPVDPDLIESLRKQAIKLGPRVYLLDRSVSTKIWWEASSLSESSSAQRFALYSVKGGVGRSTTAVVLSRFLAGRGERVLVLDLDLESPGLSGMLDHEVQPRYGITDWLVEDLVRQGNEVFEDLCARPRWDTEFAGSVQVVPAWGKNPGEYLAKVGRVYMDTKRPWNERVQTLIKKLERRYKPTVILLESRSGLHDLAAAPVTNLSANVLLFAVDSSSTWTGYNVLFKHWSEHNLSPSIRDKLWIVSALTPQVGWKEYIELFRDRAWELFRNNLYDEVGPTEDWSVDRFSFDRTEPDAPHDPLPVYWTSGLGAGSSLSKLPDVAVETAYKEFCKRFEYLFLTD